MVLREIAYQTIIDGDFPKLASSKRNSWPKFPLNLEFLILQNSTHASILGKVIVDMNLGEAPKRMHDPKSYLASHFVQEHQRIQYAHQGERNDSIYRENINFLEVLIRIVDPNVKAHIFKYQKVLKIYVLHFRQVKLVVEENIQKQNLKKEVKEKAPSSSSDLESKSK